MDDRRKHGLPNAQSPTTQVRAIAYFSVSFIQIFASSIMTLLCMVSVVILLVSSYSALLLSISNLPVPNSDYFSLIRSHSLKQWQAR
jgi:hypothetical protein